MKTTGTKNQVTKKPKGKTGIDKVLEKIIVNGDLSLLTKEERLEYYRHMCKKHSVDMDTRPFEFIWLDNRMVLYATKACSDQLRIKHSISVKSLEILQIQELIVAKVTIVDKTGREDSDVGAVSLSGNSKLNAADMVMTAVTKAKRRATLSMCGVSILDETEIASIPQARQVIDEGVQPTEDREKTLSERQEKIEMLKKLNEQLRRRMAKYMGLTEGIKLAESCNWDEDAIAQVLEKKYESKNTN